VCGALVVLSVLVAPAAADRVTGSITTGANPSALAVNVVTNRIYVCNYGANTITVIDGTQHSVLTTVTVGNAPSAVAVNPVTNKIYVANYGSNTVSVVDGATNATTTVGVGVTPYSIAVNPVTNKIYVANYGGANVSVIDGATNTTTTVAVGSNPSCVAVNPVTNRIYVTSSAASDIRVIDGATNATTTVSVGAGPWALAVNPVTNRIYTANYSGNSVTVIDGATNSTTTVAVGTGPQAIAVNQVTDKVYVADRTSGTVTVIDGATNSTTTVGVGSQPTALAVNAVTNKVYVANAGSNNVTAIDGVTLGTTTLSTGTYPSGVAVNPVTNRIYVANQNSNNVSIIDGANKSVVYANLFWRPQRVEIDPVRNKIYALDCYNGNLHVIDGETHAYQTIYDPYRPADLAFNPVSNKVYLACGDGDSCVWEIDGATLGTTYIRLTANAGHVAVNTVTNRIYVSCEGRVVVIDGVTRATTDVPVTYGTGGPLVVNEAANKVYVATSIASVVEVDGQTNATTSISVAGLPHSLAVNPITNKIYVATWDNSNCVTVIDGATRSTTNVGLGGDDAALVAVNQATNKIYATPLHGARLVEIDGATNSTTDIPIVGVAADIAISPLTNTIYANWGSNLCVVDGSTRTWDTLATGSSPADVAVNPVTGRVYVPLYDEGRVAVYIPSPNNDTKVRCETGTSAIRFFRWPRPSIAGKAVNRSTPGRTRVEQVMKRLGNAQQAWSLANIAWGAGTDSAYWTWTWGLDSLVWGENLICGVTLESDVATSNNHGIGTPFAGNMLVYPVYRTLAVTLSDVGVAKIDAPAGSIEPMATITPSATWHNYGPDPGSFRAWLSLYDPFMVLVYQEYRDVSNLAAGEDIKLDFPDFNVGTVKGLWFVRCSTACSTDFNPGNNVLPSLFSVGTRPPWPDAWEAGEPMPLGSGKSIKDGGWLAPGEDGGDFSNYVFAAKGNKTSEFYRYEVATGLWAPAAAIPMGREGKLPGKGCKAVADNSGHVYMVKGNNTQGFWRYSAVTDSWKQMPDVPLGSTNKKVKAGSDMAFVEKDGQQYVYFLKGQKDEFWRFKVQGDSWEPLQAVPVDLPAIKTNAGSWIELVETGTDAGPYIYLHKAKYHHMYRYNLSTDAWETSLLPGMPFAGRSGKTRRSKDGGSAAFWNGHIYSLKGGNTCEFWRYAPVTDSWVELDPIPEIGPSGKKKKVKAGGDIVHVGGGAFFVIKGNSTNDCWRMLIAEAKVQSPVRTGVQATSLSTGYSPFAVAPNPLRAGFATLQVSGQAAQWSSGPVTVSIYDASGRCVLRQASGVKHQASSVVLDLRSVPAGVYLLRLAAGDITLTRRLVVQR
jgi:YVTN family beta-propeller protein